MDGGKCEGRSPVLNLATTEHIDALKEVLIVSFSAPKSHLWITSEASGESIRPVSRFFYDERSEACRHLFNEAILRNHSSPGKYHRGRRPFIRHLRCSWLRESLFAMRAQLRSSPRTQRVSRRYNPHIHHTYINLDSASMSK